jgi:hypothetical protein
MVDSLSVSSSNPYRLKVVHDTVSYFCLWTPRWMSIHIGFSNVLKYFTFFSILRIDSVHFPHSPAFRQYDLDSIQRKKTLLAWEFCCQTKTFQRETHCVVHYSGKIWQFLKFKRWNVYVCQPNSRVKSMRMFCEDHIVAFVHHFQMVFIVIERSDLWLIVLFQSMKMIKR